MFFCFIVSWRCNEEIVFQNRENSENSTPRFFQSDFSFAVSPLICYCEGDGCPPHHINNTCIAPLTSKCFASLREEIHEATGHREIVETYGCLPADESTIMQCKGNLVPHRMRTTILCCDGEDLCNEQLQPELKPLTTLRPTVSSKDEVSSVTLAVVALVVVFLLGLIAMGVFLLYTYQ